MKMRKIVLPTGIAGLCLLWAERIDEALKLKLAMDNFNGKNLEFHMMNMYNQIDLKFLIIIIYLIALYLISTKQKEDKNEK